MSIIHVVGTRPNFVKAAPVFHKLQENGFQQWLIHTGQHYDDSLSGSFFRELDLPVPDLHLDLHNTLSQSAFIARLYESLKSFCETHRPKLAMVYGDVNSTLAAAICFHRLGIAIAHVEAGLRSFDNTMPEEINRIMVDHLSSLLFTSEPSAHKNLESEGVDMEKVHYVGNCMIDSLHRFLPLAQKRKAFKGFGMQPGQYVLCTFHRPGNVDNLKKLGFIHQTLTEISRIIPVLFPIHPRTRDRLEKHGYDFPEKVTMTGPVPYLDFISLMADAAVVLTDSGGIQEETTWLNVPCLTLRPNTERPVTIDVGTNKLVDYDVVGIVNEIKLVKAGNFKRGTKPEKWDGRAGERLAHCVKNSGLL